MDIYICKKCGRRMLTCDLVRSKCSENFCGSYLLNFCPDCFGPIEKEPKEQYDTEVDEKYLGDL